MSNKPLKILVDEMDDGMDEKLEKVGGLIQIKK